MYPLLADSRWVVISDICLGDGHRPLQLSKLTTFSKNEHASKLQPCDNQVRIKETFSQAPYNKHHPALTSIQGAAMLIRDNMGETFILPSRQFQQLDQTFASPVTKATVAQQQEVGIQLPYVAQIQAVQKAAQEGSLPGVYEELSQTENMQNLLYVCNKC